MIILNEKLKTVLYWALTTATVLVAIEFIYTMVFSIGYIKVVSETDINNHVSAYGMSTGIINGVFRIITSILYLVFLLRSLRCLKRDNFFSDKNAYMLVCIAGMGVLVSIVLAFLSVYLGVGHILVALPQLLSNVAPSAFMLCIALLYLAAVRSEETEKLTI